jgi:exopolysaccharide biosynthesis polyprenyl glycosylphosphotransferase
MSAEREATVNAILPLTQVPSLSTRRSAERQSIASPTVREGETAGRDFGAPAANRVDSTPFSRNYFLQLLRREKRRADRTHSPLSVVVYRVASDDKKRTTLAINEMLHVIAGTVRETDIVGRLGSSSVAILCPDTSAQGASQLMRKVAERAQHVFFSEEAATYPDHHFDELTSGEWSPPETHPLFIDEFKSSNRDGYRVKRFLDVVGALCAVVLFSPLMLLTAIAVAITSPGPIIFKQKRLGRSGVPFTFYKFRSMRTGNDDSIHRQYVQNLIKGDNAKVNQQTGTDPLYKIKSDPRVTSVGRLIRKTSIDELPQLFNVLKGDMSLVGPRPPLPYEAENYRSWHLRRVLDIKPGITGLWQVEGRSKVSFDEMVRLDLRYIRSCSLALDLRILLKTVLVVLTCDGAT